MLDSGLMLRDRPPALPWFLAILAVIAGWQALYCAVATQGKLRELFYISEQMNWHATITRYTYVKHHTED